MKRLTAIALGGLLILGLSASAIAHWSGGYMHDFWDNSDNRGWMHRGYDRDYGDGRNYGPAYCWNYFNEQNAVDTAEKAKVQVEEYIKSTGNPNLKAGEVVEQKDFFEIDIVTKDGSLADKILVDKRTGRLFSAYR